MPPTPLDPGLLRPWQRGVVVVLAVVVVVHTVLLILWLAPASPLRDAFGREHVGTYIDPYFRQSTAMVGPGALAVDETMWFRARIRGTSGESTVTPWVELVALETASARHRPFVARAHLTARRLATNINYAMLRMSSEQRAVTRSSPVTREPDELRDSLRAVGGHAEGARDFLVYDQMTTQFLSLYAKARWKGTPVEIQYITGRRLVEPIGSSGPPVSEGDFALYRVGWHDAYRGSFEAQDAFDDYVEQGR